MENKPRKDPRKSCDVCLHTRLVRDEFGFHEICNLAREEIRDCISGKKDRFLTLDEWDTHAKKEPNYILDPCWMKRSDGSMYLYEVSLIPNHKKGV